MEFIRISEDKLKIMMNRDDLAVYSLDTDTMDCENTETQQALRALLGEAKGRMGIDFADDRILAQVFPDRRGGCEIYITCLGMTSLSAERKDMTEEREASMESRGKTSIYCFPDLDTLLQVCAQLKALGYAGESAAYVVGQEEYYLIIREHPRDNSLRLKALGEYSFIEEYGTRRQGNIQLAYIKEHGTCIERTEAVDRLAPLR